jgi:hypothetical protein
MVDTALLWGAGPEGDMDRLARGLVSAIPGNSATRSTNLVTMNHAEVREFSRWMAKCTVREIAEAFAAAMPCWENYPQTLEIQYRRRIYRKIWERWILDSFADAATASAYAYSVLRKYNTSLANEERKARRSGTNTGHTIYRSFSLNRDMLKDFQRTRNAFSRLDTAISARETHETLIPIARDIHRFANTRFKIRVLGAMITTFRRSQPVTESDITATLNVRYNREKGKFKEVYVISHKTGEK